MVSMPFGPLGPSLGLSQLQACLRQQGVDAVVWHAGLDFAAEVGVADYRRLAALPFTPDLTGDWIFCSTLRDGRDDAEAWLSQVLGGGHPAHRKPADMQLDDIEGWRARLLAMRQRATPFIERWAQRIVRAAPHVLALTSVFAQNVAALSLARRVKALAPDVLVCLGGANAEAPMGQVLFDHYPCLDAVVSGEGEHRFTALVAAWLERRRLPRFADVWAREHLLEAGPPQRVPPVDLATLPAPDFSDFFEQMRDAGLRLEVSLPFETSRGCWWGQKHHCTFCGLNGATMAFRRKPAALALSQLQQLRERHPGRSIAVVDNILDMNYFHDFLPALAAQDHPPRLFYEVKANLSRQQIGLLRAAGVASIQPGIESLSNDVLARMQKGLRGIQAVQLLREGARVGLDVDWNIIAGFPGEDPAEYARMAELVPLLSHLQPPQMCSPLRLDRFAPLHTKAAENGLVEVQAYPSYQHVYGLPPEALDRLASCFTFRYADGRDVDSYLAPLQAAVARWREHRGTLQANVRGAAFEVIDERATPTKHVIDGAQAWVMRVCDEPHSEQKLRALAQTDDAPGSTAVEAAIEALQQKRLLLSDGGWHLSLPLIS
jgi:ribosomal peptide maturation radical SAM protein 1